MKSVVLSFVALIVFGMANAQVKPTAKIYIDINPDNCLSCMNSLHNVEIFEKAGQDYYFVFQKKYQSEKEFILKQYRLTSRKAIYIWNDSLYDAIHVGAGSNVSLLSATGSQRMVVPMINFDSSTATYFMKRCKPIDTIHYSSDALSPLINQMEVSGDLLYSMKSLRKNAIDILNLYTGKREQIVLTDSISKLNFLRNFNSLEKWKQAAYIELPNNNTFVNFVVSGDTLLALSRHNFIPVIHGEDTVIASFYSMNLFKNGHFIQSYKIDAMALYPDYYWMSDFTYWKGVYYFALLKASTNKKSHAPFLGAYLPDHAELKFSNYCPTAAPDSAVANSRYGIYPLFQKNKFFINFGDRFYRIGDTLSKKVPLLENSFTNTDINNYKRILPQFRFNDKYVWFNYYPQKSDSLLSVKFDLSNGDVVYSKAINSSFLVPFYDDFDYNYIYIPLDSRTIVRKYLK